MAPGCMPFPPTTHAAFSVGTQDSQGTRRHATLAKPTGPLLPPSHQRGLYAGGLCCQQGHSGRPCSPHTHVHIHTHTHTHKCTHAFMRAYTHSHTCAKCRDVRGQTHTHVHTCTHVQAHTYTCMCAHTATRTHTGTFTHTAAQTRPGLCGLILPSDPAASDPSGE